MKINKKYLKAVGSIWIGLFCISIYAQIFEPPYIQNFFDDIYVYYLAVVPFTIVMWLIDKYRSQSK
jgi:hypothetical protein